MTASEWNAKHPIGTRVIVKNDFHNSRWFTETAARNCDSAFCWCGGKPEVTFCGYHPRLEQVEPISAYPGDMYDGKPLKKVRSDFHD